MGTFIYKAVSAQGRFSEGRLDAADKPSAVAQIELMGLIPVVVEEPARARPSAFSKLKLQRISRKDILFFTEELSTLVEEERRATIDPQALGDHARCRFQDTRQGMGLLNDVQQLSRYVHGPSFGSRDVEVVP